MDTPLNVLASDLPLEMALHRQQIVNEIKAASDIEKLRELAIAAVDLNFATRACLRKMNPGSSVL
jgi:hypothetical protein